MIDILIEIGRCYGMEMNVEKTKVMSISRQPLPIQITVDQKQLENVEYFNCLGSMITNSKCTREIQSRIAVAKVTFNRKTLHQKIGPQFRNKLVKCNILSIAFYGAETWTLWKVD